MTLKQKCMFSMFGGSPFSEGFLSEIPSQAAVRVLHSVPHLGDSVLEITTGLACRFNLFETIRIGSTIETLCKRVMRQNKLWNELW